MKKFTFKLERVLNYRRRSAERALASFQEQMSKVQQQQAHIANLKGQITGTLKSNQERIGSGGASSNFLQVNSELVAGLHRKIKDENLRLRQLVLELEDRKQVLLELRREQKSLELLKDKKLEDFKKERSKFEQKALDDLVVMRNAVKGEL